MTRPLHVALVAPPYFAVPPDGYGGIEAMVATLVDALVARGHRVTLVAAGAPRTRAASTIVTYAEPQVERVGALVPELVHAAEADRAIRSADVDVVHEHTIAGLLLAGGRRPPTIATVHGAIDDELRRFYRALDVPLVAISQAQRARDPELPWLGTVHNGIDPAAYTYRAAKEDHLLFLGRISPQKGVRRAIVAARAAGRRLVIAAKCSAPDERRYLSQEIRPLLGPDVEYVGEVGGAQKRELLASAAALLFPIDWEEPFGMVMVEAMASGTPVVAFRRGAVPEVVEDGVTGIICDAPRELPAAIERACRLDPAACRARVERCFSPDAMAAGYESLYAATIGRAVPALAAVAGSGAVEPARPLPARRLVVADGG